MPRALHAVDACYRAEDREPFNQDVAAPLEVQEFWDRHDAYPASHWARDMRRTAPYLLSFVFCCSIASPARADGLVEAIPKHLVCGDAITPGIWAPPGTTGSRKVRISGGPRVGPRVVAEDRARLIPAVAQLVPPSGMNGQCRATTIVYYGPGWTAGFRTKFRSEGV